MYYMHLECNTKIRCNITGYNCDYLILNSEFEFT